MCYIVYKFVMFFLSLIYSSNSSRLGHTGGNRRTAPGRSEGVHLGTVLLVLQPQVSFSRSDSILISKSKDPDVDVKNSQIIPECHNINSKSHYITVTCPLLIQRRLLTPLELDIRSEVQELRDFLRARGIIQYV